LWMGQGSGCGSGEVVWLEELSCFLRLRNFHTLIPIIQRSIHFAWVVRVVLFQDLDRLSDDGLRPDAVTTRLLCQAKGPN
jgi:hypothetical protein